MSIPFFSPELVKRCICDDVQRAEFIAKGNQLIGFDPATGFQVTAYMLPDGHVLIDDIRKANAPRQSEHVLIREALEKLDKYARRQTNKRMNGRDELIPNAHKGEHYPAVQSIMDQLRHYLKT